MVAGLVAALVVEEVLVEVAPAEVGDLVSDML